MSDDLAIKVENVSKDFILPHEKAGSIKNVFTSVGKRRRSGKEIQHALNNISIDIKKGEFFGIVGRNGSGKSTLLKILAGIYQPTSGGVRTFGKLVPFIELGVGFNPELTGRENVYLNGAMLGFSEKEVAAMYDDIVAFAELERFMDQKLKNYSSGMQVRLAFSMATRAKADILLIDEVLAVGDADFQRRCFTYFRKLKKDKKTVVFVSHDMEAVREYCDRAMLIEENSTLTIGTTAEVTKAYTKLFLPSESSRAEDSGSKNRWGDQAITITHINADVTTNQIAIQLTITAKIDVDSPIVGFRIRDSFGKEVTGTNTKVEQRRLDDLKAGKSLNLTWTLPNILSDGQYTIDPAVLHSDAITVADWWDEALQLNIKKSRRLPYAIDPAFDLKLESDK
ncbi:MAG: ABC transporter ATP-binding protein [Patescibacteria group bacterium]